MDADQLQDAISHTRAMIKATSQDSESLPMLLDHLKELLSIQVALAKQSKDES